MEELVEVARGIAAERFARDKATIAIERERRFEFGAAAGFEAEACKAALPGRRDDMLKERPWLPWVVIAFLFGVLMGRSRRR